MSLAHTPAHVRPIQSWFLVWILFTPLSGASDNAQPRGLFRVRVAEKEPEWTIDLSSTQTESPEKKNAPKIKPPPFPRGGRRATRKKKPGRLIIDIRERPPPPAFRPNMTLENNSTESNSPAVDSSPLELELSLSTDLVSTIRMARLGSSVAVSFVSAFMGTLRLLGPLIVARRVINTAEDLGLDYLRGRYIRKTYTRLERLYISYYDLPTSLRSVCRTISQIFILFFLSAIMEWMVGINQLPCRVEDSGVSSLCGLLWVFAVVGTGHACSTAVAVWGGPLRMQVDASHHHNQQTVVSRVFTRPWHIIQWMQNPEAWINVLSTSQTFSPPKFDPNPILFPATWVPVRVLQMLALARSISRCPGQWQTKRNSACGLMTQFLVQLALSDEWYRVFFVEKRVGWGCFVSLFSFIATAYLTTKSYYISGFAALLFMPSLIAVIVSGYMNLIIFWNRVEEDDRQRVVDFFIKRRNAVVKFLNL